jgi:hypothetical protein
MPPGESDVEIAVLQEQMRGMSERQKLHADNTEKLFNKLFDEIDELKAAMNRGKGVLAASLTFAGLIGGIMAGAIEYFTWVKK